MIFLRQELAKNTFLTSEQVFNYYAPNRDKARMAMAQAESLGRLGLRALCLCDDIWVSFCSGHGGGNLWT